MWLLVKMSLTPLFYGTAGKSKSLNTMLWKRAGEFTWPGDKKVCTAAIPPTSKQTAAHAGANLPGCGFTSE